MALWYQSLPKLIRLRLSLHRLYKWLLINDSLIPDFMDALAIVYGAYPSLNHGGYSGYGSWAVCKTLDDLYS
jgi:hypothetical protein